MRALVTAFGFLTRLPVAAAGTTPRELGRAVAYFPLVGLALGTAVAALALVLRGHLPPLLTAVLVVAVLAALTRGLHLDGVCDLFDGLGGGRGDRERTLSIMRDSHIGAHGAAALVLLLLAKVACLAAVLDAGALWGVLIFPMVARWAATPQMVLFPYARAEGLGRAFKGEAGISRVIMATGILAVVFVGAGLSGGLTAALTGVRQAAASLGVSLALGVWLRARLGGLTGDVYGATIELCETASLLVTALR